MTPPGLTCTRCEKHLYPHLARATDNGWQHARCPRMTREERHAEAARIRAERLEDLEFMLDTGECLMGAAIRLAMTEMAVETLLARAGRRDMLRALRARNPRDHNATPDGLNITRAMPNPRLDNKQARRNEARRAARQKVAA